MKRKMNWKQWLFILPTLIVLGVFSLWPVIQSFAFSFFDYRLNNQQKAGMYIHERFNANLFNETDLYVSMFLQDEYPNIKDPQDLAKTKFLVKELDDAGRKYKDKKGVMTITTAERKDAEELYKKSSTLVNELNQKYQLTHNKDLPELVKDLKNSIVPSNFTGLSGYKKALHDARIGYALWHTILFTVVSVFFEFVLGLGLAMILNKAIRGRGIIRTTSLIPWAIPTAVAALIWSYLYDGSSGIMAHFFEMIGLVNQSQDLLLTGAGAMFSAIFADVWKTTPYVALLLLAGLQNIPGSLYEAGAIDGASRIQSFFRITLPLLKPAILVALLFRTLDAFRVFDLIYVLTGGGPGGDTETLSVYAYKIMFSQTNFGYGSVIVMLMFACVAVIAIIFVKFLGANLMEKN